MQRRAAAAYVAIFVLVAAGAYGVIATTQAPAVTLQDAEVDAVATQGATIQAGGTSYTVAKIEESGGDGGGHGGGGDATVQATIEYNVTVETTTTVANGTTLNGTNYAFLANGTTYAVKVANGSTPTEVRLVEQFTVEEPTVTQDGTTYVVLEGEGDNRTLVPRSEYVDETFGEPRTVTLAEGDAWNATHDLTNVTADGLVLTTAAVETESTTVSEGGNVTLGETTYTAHFPSTSKLELTTDYAAYEEEVEDVDRYHDRINGFWMVAVLSGIAGAGLLALAYLPNKDL